MAIAGQTLGHNYLFPQKISLSKKNQSNKRDIGPKRKRGGEVGSNIAVKIKKSDSVVGIHSGNMVEQKSQKRKKRFPEVHH